MSDNKKEMQDLEDNWPKYSMHVMNSLSRIENKLLQLEKETHDEHKVLRADIARLQGKAVAWAAAASAILSVVIPFLMKRI